MLFRARFLDRFGHRSGGEMELAEKRWWEEPERVRALAEQMARGEEGFLSRRGPLEERRDAVECEILELLSREQPEALESFKRLLAEARELLPLPLRKVDSYCNYFRVYSAFCIILFSSPYNNYVYEQFPMVTL